MRVEIGAIELGEQVIVELESTVLRDRYGAAVRVEVRWDDGDASGMAATALDGRGVRQLVDALLDAVALSERMYRGRGRAEVASAPQDEQDLPPRAG